MPIGERPPSPSIQRLRDASLVKTAAKRINAEPNVSPSVNPWNSTRAASPVEQNGKSYAEALSASRPQSPESAELPLLIPTEPSSPLVKTEPVEEAIADRAAAGAGMEANGDHEVVEVSDASDQEASRTRSGRRISAPKSKSKDKKKSKKATKLATMQPPLMAVDSSASAASLTATPADTPTAHSTPAETALPLSAPATRTSRLVSESKKRRRVSTDISGGDDAEGTSSRVQDAPPTTLTTVPDQRASSVVSYASANPSQDRVDQPLTAPSDAGATDFEMIDLDPGSDYDIPHTPAFASATNIASGPTDPDAARRKRLGKQPMRDNLSNSDLPSTTAQASGAQRIAKHAIHGAIYQGHPSPPAQYAYDLARTRSGTQPPRTPSRLPNVVQRPPSPPQVPHYPVHYAPGPFPVANNGLAQPPVPHPGLPPPMVLTRPPPGGHRPIQGSDFYYFLRNILSSQLHAWAGIDDDFVFIQFPGKGAQDAGNHSRMHAVEAVLTKHLNINGTTLFQPLPEVAQPRPNADPRWYRLGNLQPRDRDTLVNGVWWDAPEGTFCVLAPNKMPPTYIGTWRHSHRLGSTTEDGMAVSFRATLETHEPATYIRAVLDADRRAGGRWRHYTTDESFQQVIASVSVRRLTLEAQGEGDSGEPVVSLYIESPTLDAAEWTDFRSYLRGLTYGGTHAGPPELIVETFFCAYCHSIDHPTYLCTVPTTPGWHGPSLDAARNAITAERRNMDRNANNARGGGRGGRGRGGRGRGRRGGYRGRGGFAPT
ncbi:uncharacterized protein C8Q71DRAFT_856375 [Rhodofomes roseus]|uniref:Uncharacterized protein n=1 Tax=Rhodofomes roseus TaxID=34475 RepID=A0ABQ8KKC7_9APHY|nr:uncharacterized protein C8Q71DRAFT_856375 [Rhodofomes roseus]KAH9838424.1 hypothetical protein C8Q71DRAFT_856375 [Rhodofomes roseus]